MSNYMEIIKEISKDTVPYGKYFKRSNKTLFPQIEIEKVIFSPPATIVLWNDGSKTIVKTDGKDEFNPEIGLSMAIAKKYFGSRSKFKQKVKTAMNELENRKNKAEAIKP